MSGWTKRDLVVQAFEEIGYASYIYDAMPEQLESVLRRLDAMMASWNAKGIRLNYPLPSAPDQTSLDQNSGLPDSAYEAVYLNLAVKISPSFGKQVSQETKIAAKQAYEAMLIKACIPEQMQFPNSLPAGAGNKTWRNTGRPYLKTPTDNLQIDGENILNI